MRAFDDVPFVSFSLSGFASFGGESYWKAVERFHAFLPEFNLAGGSMYYWLIPDLQDSSFGHVSEITASGGFGNQSSKADVDEIMERLAGELGHITGIPFNYTSTVWPKASAMYVTSNKLPDEVGQNAILGSRIVTRDFLESRDGPSKVTDALRSLRTYSGNTVQGQNAIQGLVTAGPAVWANADKVDSALHPVWRKALLHIVLARGWVDGTSIEDQRKIQKNLTEVEVPILKKLDFGREGGTYLNEADAYEKDFQHSFWGANYPRLYSVKQKCDPQNLFIVRTGVGSEDWDDEGLCPK